MKRLLSLLFLLLPVGVFGQDATLSTAMDNFLTTDGELRDGVTAQEFQVYETYGGPSDWIRSYMRFDVSNNLLFGIEDGGTQAGNAGIVILGGDVRLTFEGAINPGPIAEGLATWDTDDDELLIGNGATTAFFLPTDAWSGDATQSTSGVVTIGSAVIEEGMIDNTATIASNPAWPANAAWFGTTGIIFEGSTDNTSETLLQVADPSSDVTLTLPDTTSSILGSASSPSLSGTWTFTSGGLIIPNSTAPAQTAEASMAWDQNDDLLTVGSGAANLTIAPTSISATLTNKTIDNGDNTMRIYHEKHTTSTTIAAAECYGGVHYVTAASVVLTLPAIADGMSVTIISNTGNVVTVDANASDLIILDGTALDDGDSIDSPGSAGDIVTLTYYDATGWFASSNTWVDGGP